MSGAYETDILEWSHQQASLLRRHAAGERLNLTPDWTNIIAEIEGSGGNVLRAVRSHLLQAMLHELKSRAWPDRQEVSHWRAEMRLQRGQAADDFTPSMRQKLDVAALYRRALRGLPEAIDGQPPVALPETCPWSLDQLLSDAELP